MISLNHKKVTAISGYVGSGFKELVDAACTKSGRGCSGTITQMCNEFKNRSPEIRSKIATIASVAVYRYFMPSFAEGLQIQNCLLPSSKSCLISSKS